MEITQGMPEIGFLRLPEVLKIIPVGRSSFWLGVKTGRYPAPCRLGPKTVAWRVEDIRNLVAQLSATGLL